MTVHERLHTCRPEGQLKHEGNPGQQPGAEVLGEHCPIESPRSSATGMYTFLVGEFRFSGFICELGFAFVQVDRAGLNKQTEKECTREQKPGCGHETRRHRLSTSMNDRTGLTYPRLHPGWCKELYNGTRLHGRCLGRVSEGWVEQMRVPSTSGHLG